MPDIELTILMPCLNEAKTLGTCIDKAMHFLEESNVSGEILIADNGSNDGSQNIAEEKGARVIHVEQKGYGSALIAGNLEAKGRYIIMGDSDDSYDFLNLMPFLQKLREGYELVMGNRFAGGIEKGAMPFSHRYIGNPVLSFLGRLFFKSKIKDFHCGLRGNNRKSILELNLKTTGMEYASEMVVMAELAGLRIAEVPTVLHKDGRDRAPHLRSFRDGWRHLKFLLMYSPNWLYFYPGILLCVLGGVGVLILSVCQIQIGKVILGIHTLLYCMLFVILGVSLIFIFVFTKVYAWNHHFIPRNKIAESIAKFSVDKGIFVGAVMTVIGILFSIYALVSWKSVGFGELIPEKVMRMVIPAVTLIDIGVQFIFSSFFIGILKIDCKEQVTDGGGD